MRGRYVEVTDLDAVELTDFTAIVIFSDLRRMGTFECSHAMINQLHSNVYWSMLGNFVSVPTDWYVAVSPISVPLTPAPVLSETND